MNTLKETKTITLGQKQSIANQLFSAIKRKFAALFQPEEVEVTFKMEDGHMRYTYTKVDHKQVA